MPIVQPLTLLVRVSSKWEIDVGYNYYYAAFVERNLTKKHSHIVTGAAFIVSSLEHVLALEQ